MGKRVRITSDSINSYGTRVLTAGLDTSQYERNPVLLYMHRRGTVIGYLKNLSKEDDCILAELVFDEASPLSTQCKKQWEAGSLRMVSIGIDVIETSSDRRHLVEGQTCATITKSKLYEVSLVDIGANDDAIVLRRDGRMITLGKDSHNPLPALIDEPVLIKNHNEMELKTIALQLGLSDTADEAAVISKISELAALKQENDALKAEKSALVKETVTQMVDDAIAQRRLLGGKKDEFVNLGLTSGIGTLRTVLSCMRPAPAPEDLINPSSGQTTPATYNKLSDVPRDKLASLKEHSLEEYRRLFRNEYGFDYI